MRERRFAKGLRETLAVGVLLTLPALAFAVDGATRRLAKSSDINERVKAAEELSKDGSPAAVKLLRTLVKDDHAYVRDWAVKYSRNIKDPKGVAALLPLLKQRSELGRVNAAAAIGSTDTELAGETLRSIATKDKSAAVRREVVTWLSQMPDPAASAGVLAAACADDDPSVRSAAMAALVEMKHESGARLAAGLLEDADEGVRCTALWALSELDRPVATTQIAAYRADDGWRRRVQTVETALEIRDAPCVDALIELISYDHRRVRVEAHRALRRISGKEFGPDVDVWRGWFDGQREKWGRPAKLHSLTAAKKDGDTTVRYHGIEVASEGVLFVIDKSGSMTEAMKGENAGFTRWAMTLLRLRTTIAEMPDGMRVNVVLFDDEVSQAFDEPAPLDTKTRKAVETYLKRGSPGGNTNVDGALRVGLAMEGIDTVFFLGDGSPNRGPHVISSRIRRHFETMNRRRKLVVNSISIGADKSGENLLRRLGRENGGTFVRYD